MMSEYINMLEARGAARREAALASLPKKLYDLGRDADVKLTVQDPDMRAKLYKEFHIQNI